MNDSRIEHAQDRLPVLLELYPVLRALASGDLERCLRSARVLRLRSGSIAFDELQLCRAYPFVLSGSLRVVKRSENGREILLYDVAPGDACVVSAACLLGDRPYNAVAIVQSDCELVALPAEDFEHLLSIPVFREFIFGLFSKRVVDLMLLIDDLAFRRLDRRLARLLLARGPRIEASHQALADELGTVREVVTRTLHVFAERGWVRLDRGAIDVLDAAALERFRSG